MGKKKNKCPFCDSKMVLNNNRYRCIKCGYSISGSSVTSGSSLGGGSSTTNGNNMNYGQTARRPEQQKNTVGKNVWRIVIPTFIVTLGVLGLVLEYMPGRSVLNDYEYNDYDDMASDWSDEYDTEKGRDSYLPESELFRKFVSEVFQKDYTKVSKKEYASITSICLNDDYNISYSIDDGEEKVIYFGEYLSEDMEDLQCFPNLKKIDISNGSYSVHGDWLNKLIYLEEIATRESPASLAEWIDNKENIRSITVGYNFLTGSLDGIEEFTNLEALYVETDQIEDVSCLSGLEHLETLVIEDGNMIDNFGTLASLKNLKKLSITAKGLKNIDFMNDMAQLEDVTICESSIKSIEPLRSHKDKLKQLTLMENYDVTDYSLVDEFTGLEEASIGFSYDDTLPTFAGMTNMKKLHVHGAREIAFIGNAVNVTELTLSYSELNDLTPLNQLKDLKILHINDARSYTKSLSSLMQLTGLEVLDISKTHIFGYVEELLSLPNLQEFYMDECYVAFDFNKLTGNENLKILSMNAVDLCDYGPEYDPNHYYANGEEMKINISDYAQAFQKFPNLTELYLRDTELENVEFARGLSKLEMLDISDNYISSVAPLTELENLNVLWCEDNDITDLTELGETVKIIEK